MGSAVPLQKGLTLSEGTLPPRELGRGKGCVIKHLLLSRFLACLLHDQEALAAG